MKRVAFISIYFCALALINAQTKKQQDQKAIKDMCGCYEVGFNFAETFSYSKDSTYKPSKKKHAKAIEWVQLVEDADDKIAMQHLLVINDTMVIKHWRQDWLFQNTDQYLFNANNNWKFNKLSPEAVKGQWTQRVFQVDDSPRYEGSATWVHVDGKSFWENRTSAPLPRREYTKRSDYNVTVRGNRHEITKTGWNHLQNNDKVIRASNKEDIVLAKEFGLNTYTKVDDSKCVAAQKWWKENTEVWKKVRNKWSSVFSKNKDLTLSAKVKNKRLYKYLFDLEATAKDKEISDIIDSFVVQQ
ncbi:DUF6607 family protein [Aquimarina hainanensis]|uniref:DUF6607 family protein n=1 Tax=Aquimarina hainanensis TaxID=1578017 RepID=A0ABW5N376_9FLAO